MYEPGDQNLDPRQLVRMSRAGGTLGRLLDKLTSYGRWLCLVEWWK